MAHRKVLLSALAATLALAVAAPGVAKAPATWDGLVQVKSKRFDLVYLQPGADFRQYTKVMIDPTEVAFRKDWRRDYNRDRRDISATVSEAELQDVITKGVAAASEIFDEAATKGGYPVVTTPGPDVMRLRTAVLNINVVAPERNISGRMRTFSDEAGQATFVVEARDSVTGALLGRAVDQRIVGDNTIGWRNSVTNRADFRMVVNSWADASIKGINELKSLSPINSDGHTR